MSSQNPRLKVSAPRLALLLVIAGVFLLMIVPYGAIEYLRHEFAWAERIAYLVHGIAPGGNPDHVVAFGLLGIVAWFAQPGTRPWRVALAFVVLGAVTELVQVWVPSRHPSVAHALMDVAGGLAGFGLSWLANYAWGVDTPS